MHNSLQLFTDTRTAVVVSGMRSRSGYGHVAAVAVHGLIGAVRL
jgi:hypothetical protein